MKFTYKVFKNNDTILAISDSSIVGKKFEEGDLVLDVSENFYSDKVCDEEGVLDLIKSATIVNAVGEEIVALMLRENIINESGILRISGVPHVQIITIKA